MGHRCNYLIKEGAQTSIFYSQWGALGLLADVLAGPTPLVRMIRECTPEKELLDSVFAEGVVLVDLDRNELTVWGGSSVQYLRPVRAAYLQLLQASWPKWKVGWSRSGIVGIVEALGGDTTEVERNALTCPDVAKLEARSSTPFTWATLLEEGAVLDVGLNPEPGEVLLLGPSLLQYVRGKAPGVLPREDNLGGGVLVCPEQRSLHWWSSGRYWPSDSQLAACWPGWGLQYLEGGLPAQVKLSGREPHAVALSEAEVCAYLTSELFPRTAPDPVNSLLRLAERLRQQGNPVTINPEALRYPSITSSETEH